MRNFTQSVAYRRGRRNALTYLRSQRQNLPAPQSPYNGAELSALWLQGFESVTWKEASLSRLFYVGCGGRDAG